MVGGVRMPCYVLVYCWSSLIKCSYVTTPTTTTVSTKNKNASMFVFQKLLTAVFQHESGIPGNYPGKAKRGFAKLATSGTQLEFPQFEKVGEKNASTQRCKALW